MKPERQIDWERLKTIALSLGLPGIEETTSRGQPTLKAHGKLWVWWSPHEDALVFQVAFEEREILVEAEPSRSSSPLTTKATHWSSCGRRSWTSNGRRRT